MCVKSPVLVPDGTMYTWQCVETHLVVLENMEYFLKDGRVRVSTGQLSQLCKVNRLWRLVKRFNGIRKWN